MSKVQAYAVYCFFDTENANSTCRMAVSNARVA